MCIRDRLGVELKLDMEATADKIAEMNPDAVLVATGSKSVIPEMCIRDSSKNFPCRIYTGNSYSY